MRRVTREAVCAIEPTYSKDRDRWLRILRHGGHRTPMEYATCETPAEHAERIVALEELVADILAEHRRIRQDAAYMRVGSATAEQMADWHGRCRELGIDDKSWEEK